MTRFPAWLFRSRLIRQVFYGSCRVVWRIKRATLARAVLVVRNRDGRILVLGEPSGTLQLPLKMLDGRVTVTTQVDDWLQQILPRAATPSLVAVEGTGGEGITFVYKAEIDVESPVHQDECWLPPEVAALSLNSEDARVLKICTTP